jgi:sigma-B regulation protein RsbU (phosphoserine phosphatase)
VADNNNESHGPEEKKKGSVEFNLAEIKKTIHRDFKDAREFYLDEDNKRRLEGMGRIKKWFFTSLWLFKGLFLKLTPVRRILLIISLIFIFMSVSATIGESNMRVDSNLKIVGGVILLFILMLELKDKLLARDELIAGRSVQEALLPQSSPSLPGWDVWLFSKPANDVGGDLLDFIQLEKNRFGFTLGDVSGKGLPAALLMAKLQSTLRALINEVDSIDELGTKMNDIFQRDTVPTSFASLIYLECSGDSNRLEMLNAGHMPPLILRNKRIHPTEKGDRALGISRDSVYSTRTIELERGDLLVVYSDGVTEAQNEKSEFFGYERLITILTALEDRSVADTGKDLLRAVEDFVGEAPVHDDLSIMLLKKN